MILHRFHYLLITIFVLFLALPILPMIGDWSRYLASLVFVLMLLAAVAAAVEKRWSSIISISLCAIITTIEVTMFWYDTRILATIDMALSAVFIGFVTAVILKHLFRTKNVTVNTISAALCAYLLMAILWAELYALIELIQPGSFAINSTLGGESANMQYSDGRASLPLYFSLVTITTLGYGDIVPVSHIASMLVSVEAVIGQFYLTVIVAWLVGMYISSSMRDKSDNPA